MKNRIRAARERMGLTQLEVAAATGIYPTVISELENGKRRAYPGWRQRLATALETPEEELFPEADRD